MTEWLQERIPKLDKMNWLYQTICFLMGKRKKKLTYENMYVLLYGLNRNSFKEEDSKKLAMTRVIEIYKSLHNNNLPKGVEYDDK
jgi:hypothetical protein